MARAGLVRGALYLIRPDGYLALADARADAGRLRRYFDERGLAPLPGERGRVDSRRAA